MGELNYLRCRFAAKFPDDLRYTRSHYWVREKNPGLWQVGLTPWAVRLLGDFVEYRFNVAPGAEVKLGQEIGSLEAFKALTDIFSVGTGTFQEANPLLTVNLDIIAQDCYGNGWLYMLKGSLDPELLDAQRYAVLLDQTIDEIRGSAAS
jgi:glycine cleavage system H protein